MLVLVLGLGMAMAWAKDGQDEGRLVGNRPVNAVMSPAAIGRGEWEARAEAAAAADAAKSSGSSTEEDDGTGPFGNEVVPSVELSAMCEVGGMCQCSERDGVWELDCEDRGLVNASMPWNPPPARKGHHLYLSKNVLSILHKQDFYAFSGSLLVLHLGSTHLNGIEGGSFEDLAELRELYLNNNNLETFHNDTFLGLVKLEYLQADYNFLRRIEPGAFTHLVHLRVLILNDNLLTSLPRFVFRSLRLTHLDLRGNRIQVLRYAGVLENLNRVLELQLSENPWNCSCELLSMRRWLANVPYSMLLDDVMCESPFRLHGKHLRELTRREQCPRPLGKGPTTKGDSRGKAGLKPGGQDSLSRENGDKFEATTADVVLQNSPQPIPVAGEPSMREEIDHAGSQDGGGKSGVRSSPFSSAVVSTVVPTVRQDRSTRPPRTSRPHATPRHRQAMVEQADKAPIAVECPNVCSCVVHTADLGLTVNCQERGLERFADLHPIPSDPSKVYLTGNSIQNIMRHDLSSFSRLQLLHLANNRISFVQERAFNNMSALRRLHLNGNDLARITPEMLAGLSGLQYLYLEYNVIREIHADTFNATPTLRLLFLNNNLLRFLPHGAFTGMPGLARLNLRANHFTVLPASHVLGTLTSSLIQVDLHENPWECGCSLTELRNWLEALSTGVVLGEVTCESPRRLAGRDIRAVPWEEFCSLEFAPHQGDHVDLPSPRLLNTNEDSTPPSTVVVAAEAPASPANAIPLSVLILSLLVVFIVTIFGAAGVVVFVLRRRSDSSKAKRQSSSSNSRQESSGLQLQYTVYGQRHGGRRAEHAIAAPGCDSLPLPHFLGRMCHNPIYEPRDWLSQGEPAFCHGLERLRVRPLPEDRAGWRGTGVTKEILGVGGEQPKEVANEVKGDRVEVEVGVDQKEEGDEEAAIRTLSYHKILQKERELQSGGGAVSPVTPPVTGTDVAYRRLNEVGTSQPGSPRMPFLEGHPAPETFPFLHDPEALYRRVLEREELQSLSLLEYKCPSVLRPDAVPFDRTLREVAPHEIRIHETLLCGPQGPYMVGPSAGDYLELRAKLHADADYLQLLEKRSGLHPM
uniref:SLIT and NTRK-like family, member 5a n=1 Tax=Eptatretus burgeri TaxID=7764 RepID=A0A8C4QBU5_EPTBU